MRQSVVGKTIQWTGVTVAFLGATPGFAQSTAAQDGSGSGRDIVVTATGIAQPIDQTGQAITVIDRALLNQRQSIAISDVLATTPGISVARNGGIGSTTGVFIRGASPDETLVLIDGVRVNDPSSPAGAFNYGDLLAGPVERMEVLRGSNSVAWGSQAIGGVVNITTRQPNVQPSVTASGEYGYANSVVLRGSAGAKLGPLGLSASGAYYDSDGISQYAQGTERDGYQNTTLSLRGLVDVSSAISLDLRGYYILGNLGIDGFPPPNYTFGDTAERQRTEQFIGYAGTRINLLDGAFVNHLAYTFFRNDRHNVDPDGVTFPGFDSINTFVGRGESQRLEYKGVVTPLSIARLIAGYDHERQTFRTQSFGGPVSSARASTDSLYGLAIVTPITPLTLTAGLRYDHHSDFGSHTTFGANGSFALGKSVLLRASYGEGFKAPTLYQLQGDYGNPALQPETSKSYEGGISFTTSDRKAAASLTYFFRKTRNLILFIDCDPSIAICAGGARPFGTYDNIALARAEGIEAELTLRPTSRFALSANYTLTRTRDETPASATFGKRLLRRPVDVASMSADWNSPLGLALGGTIRMVGDSFDNASNSLRLDGYALVDLRASFAISHGLEIFGRVENLFNSRYETVRNYGTYPVNGHVGVRLRWGGTQ